MTAPVPATFDRDALPPLSFLRALPAEQRGVFHALQEALKAARSAVFRSGHVAMDLEQIARVACEDAAVLQRVAPRLMHAGYLAQDEDGAFYSPHLVERQIRREERAAAKAAKEARQAAFEARQAAGEFAPEASLKAMTSRENARKGGRPRAGETPEQAYERRARAEAQAQRQREMRLLSMVEGGQDMAPENQNQFSKPVLVSELLGSKPVSGVSVDLESEDISQSNSKSTKPGKTETVKPGMAVPEIEISTLSARVMTIAGLPPAQEGFVKSICGSHLRDGVPADVVAEAVRKHTAIMEKNGDRPQKMGCFAKPIRRYWADVQAGLTEVPSQVVDVPAEDVPEWQQRASDALALAMKAWNADFEADKNFGRLRREWPEKARALGLPECEPTRENYLRAFAPKEVAA